MNYGNNMKYIRTYNLHTQEEVANKIRINKNTYTQYELQNKIIPIVHLINFCDLYKVSINFTIGLSNEKYDSYEMDLKNYKPISKVNRNLISKRLKEIIKALNLSITIISKEVKIPRTTINNYINEKSNISLNFLYSFCKKYNISADYLLGKIDNPKYLK